MGRMVLGDVEVGTEEWFRSHGVSILLILLVALLLTIIGNLIVKRMERRLAKLPAGDEAALGRRTATATHALLNTIRAIVWTITLFLVLDQFGVSLAPLIAGAGIAAAALGFGAQTLVRDGLSGFFILIENQFGVGDVIDAHTPAGVISGRVEDLTLRITALRAFDGALHFIPNGNLQVVSNKSRSWARAIVDVRIAYDEKVDRARKVLEELFEELRKEEPFKTEVKSGPEVLGIDQLAEFGIVIRVVAETKPERRWAIERALRGRIAQRLNERGIRTPAPPVSQRQSAEPGTTT
jgi:moderate conductance mechanosensitive channel